MQSSPAQVPFRTLSPDQSAAIRNEVAAILASDSFSSSRRCQEFLECVVKHALAGEYESLTERFLGVELFGRAVDYETATDSIVRVRANDVRKRLAQYNSRLRPNARVRIDLVAGGYIPEFHWKGEPTAALTNEGGQIDSVLASVSRESEEDPRSARGKVAISRWWHGVLTRRTRIISIATMIGVAALTLAWHDRQSNFDRFWQPVLNAASSPVISLPTTDTIQLKLDPMRTLTPLNELKPGDSITLRPRDIIEYHDWHVSVPVLQATLSVDHALERRGKVPLVRIGTDIRRDEVRGHPVIAIGSFSNPWVEQNVSGLRFVFDRGISDREPPQIVDTFNPQRSWSLPSTYPDPQSKDYAIITRTFDPLTREPFVSLAGLHSFGNQIAAEFVSQDSSWDEVARRAPSGWKTMNLQVLIEANIIGTTPGSTRVVDVYFWK